MSKGTPSRPPFTKRLAAIRQNIDALEMPRPVFAVLEIQGQQITLTELSPLNADSHTLTAPNGDSVIEQCLLWLKQRSEQENIKYIAIGITPFAEREELGSRLWLELDCVPFLTPPEAGMSSLDWVAHLAQEFDAELVANLHLTDTREVIPAWLTTLDEYQRTVPPELWQDFTQTVEAFKQENLLFISATPRGGGVALMRHAMMRLFRLMGVDAHWHVLIERAEVFDITKSKFHNVLQAVAPATTTLTPEDQALYISWSAENAQLFEQAIKDATVIVIDDPQPAGIIPHILKHNPQVKLLYRSHIQIEAHLIDVPDSPQQQVWQFLWQFIKDAQVFIAHPVTSFIPSMVPPEIIRTMPPTTDPLDGLNKTLTPEQRAYNWKVFNRILIENNQAPLDMDRPYITQIARFDPSKGIPDVIEAFRLLREKLELAGSDLKPQLILAGHGSIDDPDGVPIYTLTMELLREPRYAHLAADVKVARLHHSDQLLNTILSDCFTALQLSHREGYEIKVTEALMKGKPVVAYRAGGIPLQITEKHNGFLAEVGETDQVAEYLFRLFTDDKLYQDMTEHAAQGDYSQLQTISNARNWLKLALEK